MGLVAIGGGIASAIGGIGSAVGGVAGALGGAAGIGGLVNAGTGIAGALNSGSNAKQTESQINGLYQPYTAAGAGAINQINNLLTPGYDASGYIQSTPGYQFQYDQGLQAGDRAANAAGTLNSGGTLEAQTRYGQDFAQNAYQTALTNLYKSAGLGVAATGDMASNIATGNQGQTNATNSLIGQGGNLLGNFLGGSTGGSTPVSSLPQMGQGPVIAANQPLVSNPLSTTGPTLSFGGI